MVKRYNVSPFQANYGFLAKKETGKVGRNSLKMCRYNTFQTLRRRKYFLFQKYLHNSFSKIEYRNFFFSFSFFRSLLFFSFLYVFVLFFLFCFVLFCFCFFQTLTFLKKLLQYKQTQDTLLGVACL